MPTSFIYAIVVLIWGTTWFIIKFQLGVVAPEISLVYRFGLAAVCVFAYAHRSRGTRLIPSSVRRLRLRARATKAST